ncbi:MAG: lipase family protein [Phycisphaeraceae bacterium]|nr:lipase family protein [Phycisphaeraceae bacterium]
MGRRSWTPLLRPGQHRFFFEGVHARDFEGAPSRFEPTDALLLAELSHWIYRRSTEAEAGSDVEPIAGAALAEAGWREKQWAREGTGECALIEATDRDLAVLVFKGTSRLSDWLANFDVVPSKWVGTGRVHRGFASVAEKLWEPFAEALQAHRNIFYTGHSLGAALATLTAALHPPTGLCTFGSPRVGDEAFAESLAGVPIHRVVNHTDAVVRVPPSAAPFHYMHVGAEQKLGPHEPEAANPNQTMDGLFGRLVYSIRQKLQPPDDLWDHAPVNYVNRLRRLR